MGDPAFSPNPEQREGYSRLPSLRTLAPGTPIGPYKITEYLAHGGSSLIYKAAHSNGTLAALKLTIPDVSELSSNIFRLTTSPEQANSPHFLQEGEQVACAFLHLASGDVIKRPLTAHEADELLIQEHHVLKLANGKYGFPEVDPNVYLHNNRPVIAMELIEGNTLRHFLSTGLNIRLNWIKSLALQLQNFTLETRKPGHGDLKPENIIVTSDSVRLLDPVPFPLPPGRSFASLPYNPLLLPAPRADLFAIGVMLYETITGQLPWQCEQPLATATKTSLNSVETLEREFALCYVPAETLKEGAPPAVYQLIKHCLFSQSYNYQDLAQEISHILQQSKK